MRHGKICGLGLALLAAASAGAEIKWTAPFYVNRDAPADGAMVFDTNPQVATDGRGAVVVVWERVDTAPGVPIHRVFAARSLNGGRAVSEPIPLFPGIEAGNDTDPAIATDGKGKWLVVWRSTRGLLGSGADGDILYAKSGDDGLTWSGPFLLNDAAAADTALDGKPVVSTTGDGTWVAAWETSPAEGLSNIAVSRFRNGDVAWEAPVIRDGAALDTAPRIANDGANCWVITAQTWASETEHHEIGAFASTDDGATWSAFTRLNPNTRNAGGAHRNPVITTDRQGIWLVAWVREPADSADVTAPVFAYSVDNGASWAGPVPIGGAPESRSGQSFSPLVATDGVGNWLTVWETTETWEEGQGEDLDLLYSVSSSGGAQWTTPQPVNQTAGQDGGVDDGGASLAADRYGNWISVWASAFDLTGTNPAQQETDVLGSIGYFTGYLQGRVTNADTGEAMGSAAVWARKPDGSADRLEVTDENGFYRFDRLPAGSYSVTVFTTDVDGAETRAVAEAEDVEVPAGGVRKLPFAVTAEPLSGAIYGTVFGEMIPGDSASRMPLVGVKVSAFVNGATEPAAITYTTATGRYCLNGMNSAKGAGDADVLVTYQAAGYESDDVAAVVSPGENELTEPVLAAKAIAVAATMAGVVVAADTETPLAGASIVLRGPVNVSRQTNASGAYVFEALPSGTYTVTASKEGFATQTASLGVTAKGAVVGHNIALAGAPETDEAADINKDGVVDAIDLQLAINAILGSNLGGCDADVNHDDELNSVDVQIVANIALGKTN